MSANLKINEFRCLQDSRRLLTKVICLMLLLNLNLSSSAFAQNNHPRQRIKFEHISVDQGLSQSSARTIIQDSKGFMWIGTQDGLNRYDGYSFRLYEHDPFDESSLSDNFIFSIYEDRAGYIWVGTSGKGLNRFDRVKEKFTRYSHDPQNANSLSQNTVRVIYEDKAGTLWIGTSFGLNKFSKETEEFTHFYIDTSNLVLNWITTIFEDKDGEFWVGSLGGGLNKFDRKTTQWTRFLNNPNDPKSLSNNAVAAIYEDSFGDFWIGTLGGGLNRFDRETEEFTRFLHIHDDQTSLSNNVVWTIYEDRSGALWIGTQGGGLCEFDRQTQQFICHVNDPNDPNSLQNNIIFSIVEDEGGSLWVGTGGGGINKFDRQKTKFNHYKNNPTIVSSAHENFVWAIAEDHSGALWIGTQGGGLYHIDRKTENIERYVNDPSDPNSLSSNIVFSIHKDRSGMLWLGTDGGGLNKLIHRKNEAFAGETGKFQHYLFDASDSTSLGSNRVRKVFEDRDGTLWLGTYGGGLNKFDRETEQFTRYSNEPNNPNSLASNFIFNIYEDRSGMLWIGTWDGGLNKFDKSTQDFIRYLHDPTDPNSLSHNRVRAVFEDDSGILWVGTDYGLNRFDRETNTFTRYTKKDGLPNNVIYGILSDDHGNLWISTNLGLSRFDPKSEKFKNYDVYDGLQSNEFNTGAHLKTKNGELIFGGINGYNIFHPDDILDNPHIPPVMLTVFKILGQEVKLERAISEVEHIKLSYKNNSFSFEFAVLDYVNPTQNQYAYKLEGFDANWIHSGNSRAATYTRVEPGDYVFKVKGSNNDGVWNERGTSVEITITPPFWITWWFRTLLGLSVVISAFTWHQRRLSKIEAKKRELEERVDEKTRAAEALQNALTEVERLKNRLQAENVYLQDEIKLVHNFENIITRSEVLKKVLRNVEQVAATDATVLLLGESGTGKELLARAVHNISTRGQRPLVKVNCSTLPANLIESELFGHEKGAFTGAISRKAGRFELADGGTIFLDEIGDLPLELQSKLLRVLQEGEFERLGNAKPIKVDVPDVPSVQGIPDAEIENQIGTAKMEVAVKAQVQGIVGG